MKFFKIILTTIYILIILNNNNQKSLNIKGYIKYKSFIFKNNNNKQINNKIFKNYINIIYFGYSHCTDLCPKLINNIYKLIKYIKNSYKYKFIFISIDPKKDNNNNIQNYINKFQLNNIYGLGGNFKIIENLSIYFKVISTNTKINNLIKYKINHSNILYIFNNYININFIKLLKFKNLKLN